MTGQEQNVREIVRRPHPSDIVGQALRAAYAGVPGLPDDMATMLKRLDCAGNA